MILPFEYSIIKFIVDSTNDLLTFEIDSSISEQFKNFVFQKIKMFKASKFTIISFEPSYEEFNDIIDQCIVALKHRINMIDHAMNNVKLIDFDEKNI